MYYYQTIANDKGGVPGPYAESSFDIQRSILVQHIDVYQLDQEIFKDEYLTTSSAEPYGLLGDNCLTWTAGIINKSIQAYNQKYGTNHPLVDPFNLLDSLLQKGYVSKARKARVKGTDMPPIKRAS
jgi:hypothetical protein